MIAPREQSYPVGKVISTRWLQTCLSSCGFFSTFRILVCRFSHFCYSLMSHSPGESWSVSPPCCLRLVEGNFHSNIMQQLQLLFSFGDICLNAGGLVCFVHKEHFCNLSHSHSTLHLCFSFVFLLVDNLCSFSPLCSFLVQVCLVVLFDTIICHCFPIFIIFFSSSGSGWKLAGNFTSSVDGLALGLVPLIFWFLFLIGSFVVFSALLFTIFMLIWHFYWWL